MKVGVLGCGNAGLEFAGTLTKNGHDVHLAAVPEHDTNIRVLTGLGGLYVDDTTTKEATSEFVRLHRIDADHIAAIKQSQVLFLVVPAFAQDVYFEDIVRHAPDGQVVVVEPGRFGALRLAYMMKQINRAIDSIYITETSNFLYAAKTKGVGHIWLRGLKKQLHLAAVPARTTTEALDVLQPLNHKYVAANHVLETSLTDFNPALHSITTLMNLARLESMGPYRTHGYGVTPQVGKLLDAADAERCAVAKAYHVPVRSMIDQLHENYGLSGENAYETLVSAPVYRNQMTPDSAHHRYVSEELPYGLVPFLELGGLVGIQMPVSEAILSLGSVANGRNYRREGRHLSALGLSGLEPEDILALL